MHEGTPYGHLKVGSKDIDKDTLARITGCLPTDCEVWLNELLDSGVCSKEENTILCRRMIRDERTRNARAKGGALSVNNPNVPKQRISSDPSLGVSPASASASSNQELSPKKKNGHARQPKTPAPEDFTVTEEMGAWAVEQGVAAGAVLTESAKCFDHFRAKGEAKADWEATWRNWIRKAAEYSRARH